ncbi:unnamed protein product, partial [marine sediment metagenome]
LTHPPHDTKEELSEVIIDTNAKIIENEMYSPTMVCFCDIPIEDLGIHINKYSPFGISFEKDFIVKKGGTPIYYIPIDARQRWYNKITGERFLELFKKAGGPDIKYEKQNYEDINKGEYFRRMLKIHHDFFTLINKLITKYSQRLESTDALDLLDQYSRLDIFLNFQFFSNLKFFNHNLSDDDPDNYYYEREWRILTNIKFNIEDVRRVLIPEEYAKNFRNDCPNYYGQLTYTK